MTDRKDKADRTEPALAKESTEASEPAEPTDKIDPADPIDRIDPAEPARRRARSLFRMRPFSQLAQPFRRRDRNDHASREQSVFLSFT